MKRQLTPTALRSYRAAPPAVRKAFEKQAELLVENLQHPPLQAKKYNVAEDTWQARVNRQWRFYFSIAGDTYIIRDIIPHPK
jgi:mRNA-degrading endonuclease RelE of RelBE toxin-antitoxin system